TGTSAHRTQRHERRMDDTEVPQASAPATSFLAFHYARPHPAPHSFPTRRSSDLSTVWTRRWRSSGRRPSDRCHPSSVSRRLTMRSEEHTSELQSLRHLVCRLLLEKKKNSHLRRAILFHCRAGLRVRIASFLALHS